MTVTGTLTDKLLSTFDIHMPEKRNQLIRQYNDQGLGCFHVMETLGSYEKVSQTKYSNFSEEWIHQDVQVRTAVSQPPQGGDITFVLDPANLDANNNFFPQVGLDVQFSNRTVGYVSNIDVSTPSAPAITVTPKQQSTLFPALSAGENVIFFSASYAEGTGQPEGIITTTTEQEFEVKIIKQSTSATGSEMTNKNWFDQMTDGKRIQGYFMKSQLDMDYEMTLKIDGAMLFDEPVDNPALVDAGIRGMTGLYPWIRSRGNTDATGGTITMEDFDVNTDTLDSNFAPSELLGLCGLTYQQQIENLFTGTNANPGAVSFPSYAANGGIVYANFDKSKKAQEMFIGFSSLTKSERTYHWKKMSIFNHPRLYGAGGYDYKESCAYLPMKKTKDAKTGNYIPYFRYRYKELNNYSRKMETWPTGGAGQIRKTNDIDIQQINQRTEMGTEFCGAPQFLLVER